MKRKFINKIITGLSFVLIWSMAFGKTQVFAAETSMSVMGDSYETLIETDYDTSKCSKSDMLVYGQKSIGKLTVAGDICKQGSYENVAAYSVNSPITLKYSYNGQMNKNEEDKWNVCSSKSEKVNGIELSKEVKKGVIVVQKSSDGKNWQNATEPIFDAFEESNIESPEIYKTTKEEMLNGTFFKVTVAYDMTKLASTEGGINLPWIGQSFSEKIYDTRSFCETYTFYMCTEQNYVLIRDVMNKEKHSNGDVISNGFYIDKQGSGDAVTVSLNGGTAKSAKQFDSFTATGDYCVEITNKLNKKYVYKVQVQNGLTSTSLKPVVYESEKNKGFPEDNKIVGTMSSGINSVSNLKISQNAGGIITKSKHEGFEAYGVDGDYACIFIRLNYADSLIGDWSVVSDEYGKTEKQTIHGVTTGEVGKGAVIIQTSLSGREDDWQNVDKGKYAEGLYTTNFSEYYKPNEDVLLYQPDGQDIVKGLYVRVLYVYQVRNAKEKENIDCCEKYEFYLCSSSLGAVRFENLSLSDDAFEKQFGDAESNSQMLDVYEKAETLAANTMTTTGFKVNRKNNLTVDIEIERDGTKVNIPQNGEFYQEGKYNIHLSSDVGNKQDVTLYVDKATDEEALKRYFGSGFLSGKRIYEENYYPVYEGGVTKYHLEKIADKYLPVNGVIRNTTTGDEIVVDASWQRREGILSVPGDYEATFRTGLSNDVYVGDVRTFVFRFRIIPEGTAPGPQLNKDNLYDKYAHNSAANAYPIYYAVSYPSASGRQITLAFKDKKDAINYAYNYEKGVVEKLTDGSYKYTGTLLNVGTSLKFAADAGYDIADAMYAFAEQAVFCDYFDMSDDSTYITLKDSVIEQTDNLRTLELARSVTVFAKEPSSQRDELTDLDVLPFIGEKPIAYTSPGKNGFNNIGKEDFMFEKDMYGCDSNSVQITDSNGKIYPIKYKMGVGKQLREANCPSGIVTITEKNMGGDSSSYEAIYIAPEENTSTINVSYFDGGIEKKVEVTQNDAGSVIEADAFAIDSVSDLLDPYSLLLVAKDDEEIGAYSIDQTITGAWVEAGEYTVRIVNRLGYGYSFNVNVKDSENSVINFEGEGTEKIKSIITAFGAKNVTLPQIQREGFKLIGYEDANGNNFGTEIDSVKFKGNLTLIPIWEPLEVTVFVTDFEGKIITKEPAKYGDVLELVTLDTPENYEFSGWMWDGNIFNDSIEILSESDVVLTPVMKNVNTGDVMTSDLDVVSENVTKSEKSKAPVIIIILAALSGCVGWYALKKRNRVGQKDEIGENNDEENQNE